MTCASRFSNVCELVFDKPDADLVEPPEVDNEGASVRIKVD